VLNATRQKDPMAVAHVIPGPEPLRRLLRAAARKGVDAQLLREAEEAVEQFDRLIRHEAGDRSGLDAMISAWLPEAREKFELLSKQAVFKGMSQLKGVAEDVHFSAQILHPGDDGDHLDAARLHGDLGLRRVRPASVIKFRAVNLEAPISDEPKPPSGPRTLNDTPVEGLEGLMLEEFCTAPPAQFEVRQEGDALHYTLGGDGVGPNTAVDVIFAELSRCSLARYRPSQKSLRKGVFVAIDTPVRSMILDVLLHEDAYPGCEPTLGIYDTAVKGLGHPDDSGRELDRFDVGESIQFLGRGVGKFRAAEIPNYVEMLRYVCGKMGWDGEKFRGYRCRVEYPIYGSQICILFEPPKRPSSLPPDQE
jgi:hypothetical protein